MTISLQKCGRCGAVNYPSRSACRHCLSDDLPLERLSDAGILLAVATVHRSLEPQFAPLLPLRIGTVVLDCGPHLLAFAEDWAEPGDRVRVEACLNPLGEAAWSVQAEDGGGDRESSASKGKIA